MPDATGLELIAHELRESDADSILGTEEVLTPEQQRRSAQDSAINVFPGGDTAGA